MKKLKVINKIIKLIAMFVIIIFKYGNAQIDTATADSTELLDSVNIALTYDSIQIAKYQTQALELINYLEYNLNLLGSDTVPAQEKDIIINSSYLKLFKDPDVQIEDDLDDKRIIITNKNAQAYLKDIHFFFKNVKIKFDVSETKALLTNTNNLYFKVTLNRNLKGVDINGKSIESNLIRYVEINLDERNQDLKIASIYSTGISFEEDLKLWFNELNSEWKNYFAPELPITSTVNLAQILKENPSTALGDSIKINGEYINTFTNLTVEGLKKLINKSELNLSYSNTLIDLSALKKFSKLNILDISHSSIEDISALRNISSLTKIEMGFTNISNIEPLKYCIHLEELYMNNSKVNNLSVIRNFKNLKKIYFKNNPVTNINDLADLNQLEVLQISNTDISDLSPISNNKNLRRLNADSTLISNLNPLETLENIEVISVNGAPVQNIDVINKLPHLEKIYCNGSKMNMNDLLNLSIANKKTNIIFLSNELYATWNNLSIPWQTTVKSMLNIKGKPKVEQLHSILKIAEVDVSHNKDISDLSILKLLPKLKSLNLSGTLISNLSEIDTCKELQNINISHTLVSDISSLSLLPNLNQININNCPINSVSELNSLQNLEKLYANGSTVNDFHLLTNVPSLTIIYADSTEESISDSEELAKKAHFEFIYRTQELTNWWEPLTKEWKQLLFNNLNIQNGKPDTETLHKIAKLKSLSITENTEVNNLSYLKTLIQLSKITITKCNLGELGQLVSLPYLEEVEISNCPVYDISAVQQMNKLKKLTLKNTPLENFKALKKMTSLVELDISGSQIKSLKNIDAFVELIKLDISNTYIKNIKEIDELPKLDKFICFNTKISAKDIAELKAKRPNLFIEFY